MKSNNNSKMCYSSNSYEKETDNHESIISDNNISNEATKSNSFFEESGTLLDKSSNVNSGEIILNVMSDEKSRKFFVKLLGYDPRFFHVKNLSKKINEIIEEYLKAIKVEINDRLKQTFSYKGKLINLNETIKDLDHLSWITSDYSV